MYIMDRVLKNTDFSHDDTLAEYIWIDGFGELRSKIKVLQESRHHSIETMPVWNFDGSSTNQAPTNQSEILLRPVRIYKNPFHYNSLLVLCDTYIQEEGTVKIMPHRSNSRYDALSKFELVDYIKPWFGIEQEYYMLDSDNHAFGQSGKMPNQGKYYCGTLGSIIKGRTLAETHMTACLYAGLKISGMNAEVGPSQWEYQVGPVEGLEAADQLWVSRYILLRLAEEAGITISFHPKPLGSEWNGSGAHTNFSTLQTRLPGGYNEILRIIEQLRETHEDYVKNCGYDSRLRLTGEHETAAMNVFTSGVGSRDTSIRIPRDTFNKKCGYFEDRRPSANFDPYIVCAALTSAAIKAHA